MTAFYTLADVLSFLNRLSDAKIHYSLAHSRDDALMVEIDVPGERWEVEFLDDGSIEIEKFKSSGKIYGEKAIEELFQKYSEPSDRKAGAE